MIFKDMKEHVKLILYLIKMVPHKEILYMLCLEYLNDIQAFQLP